MVVLLQAMPLIVYKSQLDYEIIAYPLHTVRLLMGKFMIQYYWKQHISLQLFILHEQVILANIVT